MKIHVITSITKLISLLFIFLLFGCDSHKDTIDNSNKKIASIAEKIAFEIGATVRTKDMTFSTFQGVKVTNIPIVNSEPYEMILHISTEESPNLKAEIPDGYYIVKVDNPETDKMGDLLDSKGKFVKKTPITYEVEETNEKDKDKVYSCVSMHSESSKAGRVIIMGTSKCQWIPLFSWRKLHTVIVIEPIVVAID
jgi:hypothetical protein